MANNREQQRLAELAKEAGITPEDMVLYTFFVCGTLNGAAEHLGMSVDTLRNMLRLTMSRRLILIPVPIRNILLSDEEHQARFMDWLGAFCIRMLKGQPMPNIEKALKQRNSK